MAQESEKAFGNDGDFFHVQQADPASNSGFRDSGYYDGPLDSTHRLPFDPKSPSLEKLSEMGDKDNITVYDLHKRLDLEYEAEHENAEKVVKSKFKKGKGKGIKTKVVKNEIDVVKDIGDLDLSNELGAVVRPSNLEVAEGESEKPVVTPASVTSPSDSEYQSGKENLYENSSSDDAPPISNNGSEADSADNNDTPAENQTENGAEQKPENCVIS